MSQSLRIEDFVSETRALTEQLGGGKPVEVSPPSGSQAPEAVVNEGELTSLLERVKDERFKLMRSLKSVKARRNAAEVEEQSHQGRFESLLKQAQHLEAVVSQRSSDLNRLQDAVDTRLEQLSEIESRIESAAGRFSRLIQQAGDMQNQVQAYEGQLTQTRDALTAEAMQRLEKAAGALKGVDDQAKQSIINYASQVRNLMQADLPEAVAKNMANKASVAVDTAIGDADARVQKATQHAEALSTQIARQLVGRVKKGIAEQVAQQQHKADAELNELIQETGELIDGAKHTARQSIKQAVEEQVESTAASLAKSGATHIKAVQQHLAAEAKKMATQIKQAGEILTDEQAQQLEARLEEVLAVAADKADESVADFRSRLKASLARTVQDANATASLMEQKVARLKRQVEGAGQVVADEMTADMKARIQATMVEVDTGIEPIREQVKEQAKSFAELVKQESDQVRAALHNAQAPAEAQVNQLAQELTQKVQDAMDTAKASIDAQLASLSPQASEAVDAVKEDVRQQVQELTESAQAMMQMTDRKIQKRLEALAEATEGASAAAENTGSSVDADALIRVKNEMQAAFEEHKQMLNQDMSMMTDMIQKVVLKR